MGRGYAIGESISGNVTTHPDGSAEIFLANDCKNLPEKSFDGVIMCCNPADSLVEEMLKRTRCIVRMATLKKEIKEGERVSIDAMTGIIFK